MSAKSSNTHADLLKEAKRLAAQEAAIKRAKLRLAKRMMEAARELGGTELEQEQPARRKARGRSRPRHRNVDAAPQSSKSINPRGRSGRRLSALTWTATLHQILAEADRPLTYAELKDAIAKTHLGPTLQRTEKSFYGGLGKLEAKKLAVRHKGRVFSSQAYERFQRELAAGLVKDELLPPSHSRHQSPAKSALLEYLAAHPQGAVPGAIIQALTNVPGLNMSDKNGKTAVYNLIARLTKRGELVRDGALVQLPLRHNGAAPASDNITGRPVGIEPVRQ